jgi:hypothetical protein
VGKEREGLAFNNISFSILPAFCPLIYDIVLLQRPNQDLIKKAHKEGFPAHKRVD